MPLHASRANHVLACGLAHPQLSMERFLIFNYLYFLHILIKIYSLHTKIQIGTVFLEKDMKQGKLFNYTLVYYKIFV